MPTLMARGAAGEYLIKLRAGLLRNLSEAVDPGEGRYAALISDENVWKLYGSAVTKQLTDCGYAVTAHLLPAGEGAKTLDQLARLYNAMTRMDLTRQDVVFALGGGAVLDVTGFAAATFQRGLPVVYMPTTLTAQVDASVGGKTAVNLPTGKNAVGLFRPPHMVLMDPEVLSTLPPQGFADGMAEVMKTALIADKALFFGLRRPDELPLPELIARCLRVKIALVERDEFDVGVRQLLNMGHTIGHAFETLHGFSGCSHGQAVAAGLVTETKLGQVLGITPKGLVETVAAAVRAYNLPDHMSFPPEAVNGAVMRDKKRRGQLLTMPLLTDVGQSELHQIPFERFYAALTVAMTM